MQVLGATLRHWVDRGFGSSMTLLVVLLAVVALPGCPRVAAMDVTSEDTRTVTEQRPVSQTFTRPGHYLLHQSDMLAEPCESCEEHVDRIQPGTTSHTVITVDVLPRSDDAPQFLTDETDGRPDLALSTIHAGHVSSVPAPPPKAA